MTALEIREWFEDQLKSRMLSDSFAERLAAIRDPKEIEIAWTAQFSRVLEEIDAEAARMNLELPSRRKGLLLVQKEPKRK